MAKNEQGFVVPEQADPTEQVYMKILTVSLE
jgi:hypothetical protein